MMNSTLTEICNIEMDLSLKRIYELFQQVNYQLYQHEAFLFNGKLESTTKS